MSKNPNSFMSSLMTFWDESITCSTQDAGDKLCGAIALAIISALLLLLSHAVLWCQRGRYRGGNGGEAAMICLYSLLGNICNTMGAILSRQLHLQVILGAFATAVDAVTCILLCIPMCFCWNSKRERKLRAKRKRRRQYILEVCVLMVLTGGFLKVGFVQRDIDRTPLQRRLLRVIMEQDNSNVLGYILGMLFFVIAYTSRFPAVYRAHKERMVTIAQLFSRVLCSLAGACYASAILRYNTSDAFIWRTMPWLLSAVFCAIMDLLVVLIHLCRKGAGIQHPGVISPDTERLLRNAAIALKEKIHSTPQTKKKKAEKVNGMGCYLDVSVPPERKQCPTETTVSRKEKKEGVPVKNTVLVKEDGSFCSSDTCFDSSVLSSDLEWDFEEANIQWCEPATKPEMGDKFPLKEWQSISEL